MCCKFQDAVSVSVVVHEALSRIMEEAPQSVSIESDSMQTVHTLNSNAQYQLEVGHVLASYKTLLSSRNNVTLSLGKRTR